MNSTLNRILGVAILSLLISWVAYALFRRHELDNNFKITIGQITEFTRPAARGSGDYGLNYIYEVDHKKYSGEVNPKLCDNVERKVVIQYTLYKNFPVAYDTKHPGTSVIILSLKTAERFKYKMPDSLYPCLRHIDCDFYLNVTPEDYGK